MLILRYEERHIPCGVIARICMVERQETAAIVLSGHREQDVAVVGDKLKSAALYRIVLKANVCHAKVVGDKSRAGVIC